MKKLDTKELISILFQARNNIHFTHLLTDYNSHVILGGLYESFSDLVDRLAELQIGYYSDIKDLSPAKIEFLDVDDLEIYQNLFDNQAKKEEKEDLANALAEAVEVFSKAIYLLSLLESPIKRVK